MTTTTWTLPLPAAATRRGAAPVRHVTAAGGLRESVLARLGADPAWDADTSNVWIDGDTVVLQGVFRNASVRLATRRAAEAVPGVRRVRDARVLPRG